MALSVTRNQLRKKRLTDTVLKKNGLLELYFLEDSKSEPISYTDLIKREWVLNSSKVDLSGKFSVDEKVTISHSFAGQQVKSKEMKPKKKFALRFFMPRGRNTFTFHFASGNEWQFDVFYKGKVRDWVEFFVKIFVTLLLLQTFVIKSFFIPTGSMEDTLFPGDYILVDKVSLLFEAPKAGDIIVFQYPRNFTHDYIKRLVGMPKDELRMQNKRLIKNGGKLEEKYVVNKDSNHFKYGPFSWRDNWGPIKVKDGHYFMMGDNRDWSSDSRRWGQLPAWRLKGKAWFRFRPLERFGFIEHGQ